MAGSGFKLENEGTLPPGAATEATLAVVAGDTTSIDGKLPASLGVKAAASSLSVAMATEDAAKVPALGATASAAASPVVLATDDAHFVDVVAAVIAAGDMSGNLSEDLDVTAAVSGQRSSSLQLVSAADTREGTITIYGCLDGASWGTVPIMNKVTGAVTDGTIAVTAAVALNALVELPLLTDLRVTYTDSTGGTGAGTLVATFVAR
uniref:Uncharacterized protein n=1 Tax=viral metagenome TaxID=1070528 RepID=A0A6H1Z8N5_9ZZZZ